MENIFYAVLTGLAVLVGWFLKSSLTKSDPPKSNLGDVINNMKKGEEEIHEEYQNSSIDDIIAADNAVYGADGESVYTEDED